MAKIFTSMNEIAANSKKIVQLYSGGLDSNCFALMARQHNLSVHSLHLDLGPTPSAHPFQAITDKLGVTYYYQNRIDDFVDQFISKAIQANALYKGMFPVCSSLSRPLLAEAAVNLAKELGADTIVHNAGYLQNTATRFNNSIRALAPEINIGCPFILNELTREAKCDVLAKHSIPHTLGVYSIDENLWGRVIECGELDDPSNSVEDRHFIRTINSDEVTAKKTKLKLSFNKGLPVAIDDNAMSLRSIIETLNLLAGQFGIGRYNGLEDTVWQIKNHEVRESPAAHIIHLAHRTLETAILTQRELRNKQMIDAEWTDLIVNGFWHSKLQNALFEFIRDMNSPLNGCVELLFTPGQAFPLAIHAADSPHFHNGGERIQSHFEQLNYPAVFEIAAFSQRL